mmetsp:Transcript_81690/g.170947  ORF Transcript_81690/g.170947 Transcript_81690/m.170947 type:complete len:211 (+) Transcript_81690:1199-1831(+)
MRRCSSSNMASSLLSAVSRSWYARDISSTIPSMMAPTSKTKSDSLSHLSETMAPRRSLSRQQIFTATSLGTSESFTQRSRICLLPVKNRTFSSASDNSKRVSSVEIRLSRYSVCFFSLSTSNCVYSSKSVISSEWILLTLACRLALSSFREETDVDDRSCSRVTTSRNFSFWESCLRNSSSLATWLPGCSMRAFRFLTSSCSSEVKEEYS